MAGRNMLEEQGLEQTLTDLEDILHKWSYQDLGDTDQPKICVICWAEWSECLCGSKGRYWPIKHAIGRLKSILGFDGYEA